MHSAMHGVKINWIEFQGKRDAASITSWRTSDYRIDISKLLDVLLQRNVDAKIMQTSLYIDNARATKQIRWFYTIYVMHYKYDIYHVFN